MSIRNHRGGYTLSETLLEKKEKRRICSVPLRVVKQTAVCKQNKNVSKRSTIRDTPRRGCLRGELTRRGYPFWESDRDGGN
ncbi:hypothetical protein J6590_074351 [Homalodisca vitripennis]|nr:hypothetical protein J6590_074351 [Homalodisca vitripennis]